MYQQRPLVVFGGEKVHNTNGLSLRYRLARHLMFLFHSGVLFSVCRFYVFCQTLRIR